nr:MAG TPA: tail fiber repeat protein [Caudoviricetes sp.]
MSDEKYVGAIAAAKNAALTKAALDKKLDKTGGMITGSLKVDGIISAGMSLDLKSGIDAGGYIHSEESLLAPALVLYNGAKETSVSIDCSGDNAAKITSLSSDGKSHYARLAVGTPTGDNDAATKAYVDAQLADDTYFDVYVSIADTPVSDLDIASGTYVADCTASHTYAEIKAAADAGKTPRVLVVDDVTKPGADHIICPLVGTSGSSYRFSAPNNIGVGGTAYIVITHIDNDYVLYSCSAGELPAVKDTDNGKYMLVDGGAWKAKVPPAATQSAAGMMSAADKKKLDSMYDIVATSTDGETFDITPAQLHEKLKGVPTTCAIKVVDTIIPLYRVQLPGDGSTKYIFQITKDNGFWEPNTRLAYTASAGGTYAGTIWGKSEYDLLASTPGILKFTGAAKAQFSGSKDVTIDIPTGEGAVRYDETQELTSDQKFRACRNIGAINQKGAWAEGAVMLIPSGNDDGASVINITPGGKNNDYTLALDGGPENVPVRVSGIETPTDAQTDCAANVAYVKAKVAEVAASGGVDVDNALSATSTNPVQNKVVKAALDKKAGTAVATTSANGLMSKSDKAKLDGVETGANKTLVDAALDATSTNPVQNKAVKTALDGKADKTALDAKMDKSGGTFTGNVNGKYFCGTWLQSTAAANLGKTPGKIAVLDDAGWVYFRTPAELLSDIGGASAGHTHDTYTKAETDAAIAVRASTSAYGTTKLSNSVTSSSKTLAATPYAVKTALAQAKAYVDSSITAAINRAY